MARSGLGGKSSVFYKASFIYKGSCRSTPQLIYTRVSEQDKKQTITKWNT